VEGNIRSMKPKFVLSQIEMEELNEDCSLAIGHCPQSRYSDLCEEYYYDMLRGKLDPLVLMSHWHKHDILFNYGYSEYLSEDSLEIFDRYEEYLIKCRRYDRNNS
jgi:hypothetical protein